MAETLEEKTVNLEDELKLFREIYPDYKECELFDERDPPSEGLACYMCCCLNIPNCKCTCGAVICYHCYKITQKYKSNKCYKCKKTLPKELIEDPTVVDKLKEIKELKCPRRHCLFKGQFAQVIEHFHTCIKGPLATRSKYKLKTGDGIDPESNEVYLVENVSESTATSSSSKRSSSGSSCMGVSICCLEAQESEEREDIFTWKIGNVATEPTLPCICKGIRLPNYEYTAIVKFEDNEMSFCIPENDKAGVSRPTVVWKPPYPNAVYEFVVTGNSGETLTEVRCVREVEEVYGVSIQNDGQFYFKVRIDGFFEKLREKFETKKVADQKLPCQVYLKLDEYFFQDNINIGYNSLYIEDLAASVNAQKSNFSDELYSEDWYGDPVRVRCRASLDFRDEDNHLLVLRVLATIGDEKLQPFWLSFKFQFFQLDKHKGKVVKELFKRKIYLRSFHTAFSLSKQPFWQEICEKPIPIKVGFNFNPYPLK